MSAPNERLSTVIQFPVCSYKSLKSIFLFLFLVLMMYIILMLLFPRHLLVRSPSVRVVYYLETSAPNVVKSIFISMRRRRVDRVRSGVHTKRKHVQ